MKKYNIIRVGSDYKTTIIETHINHEDAIDSLMNIINEYASEDKIKYYKTCISLKDEITVFYYGWSGKSLHCKYFIIPFDDISEIKKPLDFIKSKV